MRSFGIVIVCYNRITGLKRLTDSLLRVDYAGRKDVDLIFSIDNSGSNIVESFASEFVWPFGQKRIRTFEKRQGLKNHILQCGDYTKDYDIIAVLEDDIMVSDSFYNYAYQAADYYWSDDRIAGISLYGFQKNWLKWPLRFEPMRLSYDSYFLRIAQSWGQVWTTPKWEAFKKWINKNKVFVKEENVPEYINEWPESSWLKYHDKYCIVTNKFFIYPYVSLTTNFSDAGTHSNGTTNDHQVELQFNKRSFVFSPFNQNAVIYDEYMNRMGLGSYLGIEDSDLTVDFYSTKRTTNRTRYLLTTRKYDYKIINTYSLTLRPIEASVILGMSGRGLYLYDTSLHVKNTGIDYSFSLNLYSLRTHDFKFLLPLSLKLTVIELFTAIKRRLSI